MVVAALVDSGSDASFINAKFALKTNYTISTFDKIQVTTANGKEMLTNTACPYTIQGDTFTLDSKLLKYKGLT